MGALWTDNKDILVMLSDMDINAIAGTLKLYFRELPEPLLTDRLYPAFMEGIGKGWEGEGDDAQTLFGIACSGMGHSQGSFPAQPTWSWQVLLVPGQLRAGGAAPQCSHSGCWEVSGCGGSCCCSRACPEPSPSLPPALSDPAAKENCMMHLLRSLPDPNLITFLFLLEHLKR